MTSDEPSKRFKNYAPSIIKIYDRDGHVLLEETSLVAVSVKAGKEYGIVALGNEVAENLELFDMNSPAAKAAREEALRDPRLKRYWKDIARDDFIVDITVGSPLRNGVIAEVGLSHRMFRYFLTKTKVLGWFVKPCIAVCAPVEMTEVESMALTNVMLTAGTRDVLIFEKLYREVAHEIPRKYKATIEIVPNDA